MLSLPLCREPEWKGAAAGPAGLAVPADGQHRGLGRNEEIEWIGAQGFYLHVHLDGEVVGLPFEPHLGYPVAFQADMVVTSDNA